MSILNLLRGLNVEVDPIKNKVTITGLRFLYVCRDLEKYIGAKMLYSILDNVSYSRLVFSMFYLPDFYHAINTLLTDPKFKRRIRSGRELLAIRTELEKIPLIANIKIINETEPNAIPKIDKSKLNKIFNNIKLFDYQDKFIDDCIWKSKLLGLNGYLLDAPPGAGKAQPLYSKVKIPGGWTTMGEIQPGDYVETDEGKYTRVLDTFPQGLRDVYEITFKDGRKVRCDENHLWKVHFYDWKLPNTCDDGYRIKTTLEMIKEHKRVRSKGKYLKIPLVTGIDRPSYRDVDLPLDPYFLGAILGDGGISGTGVHIHTPDEEIIDKIREKLIPECQIIKNNYIESTCPVFSVVRSGRENGRKNQVKEILIELGLYGKRAWEKSIPEVYFTGSYHQRLELLKGLLDTDGYAGNGGSIEFSSTSETMALQVQELVWSIGGICKLAKRQTYFTHKGVKKSGRISYRLNIRHQFPESLFHVTRKRDNLSNDNQYSRHGLKLAITDIEYIGKEETKCISILSEKKLYLTDNYIVTHNTITSISLMEVLDADTIIVVCPKKAVNNVWDETINRIYKEPQSYSMSLPVLHGPSKPAGFDINDHFIVCHYESLGKLNDYLKSIKIPNKKYAVVLDECLHPDTEVLTPTGFKSIKDVTTDDKVLQYNPDGSNSWVNPSRVVKKPTLESHHYINSRWEQVVTPNHRMIYKQKHRKSGELSLREKLSKDYYPGDDNTIVSGILINNGKTKLTPLEKLLIAIQADGSINYVSEVSKFIKIEFHLTKERKINRLLNILKDVGIEYSDYSSRNTDRIDKRFLIRIPFEMLDFLKGFESCAKKIKSFDSWVDLSDKTSDWCREFIEELVEWDGYKSPPVDGIIKYIYYSSTESINADIVQLVAANCGVRIKRTLSIDDRKETYKDNHRINMMKVSLANNQCTRKVINKHIDPVDFYCVTVPSGMFYVRYNNKVSVTGNCHSLNSHNSERSIQFRELVSKIDPIFCLWMSGTPIKALGTETMTMFATIDRLFDKSVYKSFLKVFGISGVYAISVMAHRLQLVRSEIKTNGSGVEQYTHKVKVTLQNGADYTLKTISNKMIDYVKERKEYYQKNAKKYEEDFFTSIDVYISEVTRGRGNTTLFRNELEDYLTKAKTLHNGYSPTDPKHKQYVLECNYYEDKVIIPRLPNDVKKIFRKAKSVYKYVELTIMGEALGNILGKARSRCNADMVKQLVTDAKVISEDGEIYQSNLPDLILNAQAKTIIFTDYVEVVKETEYQLKLKGFKPISIFGETTSGNGLALQTKIFKEDSEINPLITTYKTLSEAVPLTEANRVIFLNLPFRSGTYEQAVKRANRIGQTLDVDLFEVTLDTGEEPNISTRNEDILKWSEEQVALILGKKLPEENKEILHGLIETSTIEDKVKTGINTITKVASKFLDW